MNARKWRIGDWKQGLELVQWDTTLRCGSKEAKIEQKLRSRRALWRGKVRLVKGRRCLTIFDAPRESVDVHNVLVGRCVS